jgi:hypothetical protein
MTKYSITENLCIPLLSLFTLSFLDYVLLMSLVPPLLYNFC